MMKKTWITYEDFGAVGDGVHDDMEAIVRAHDYANECGLPVRAKDSATYYIGMPIHATVHSKSIQTDSL